MSVYESAVRPLLFRLDAERAHNLTLRASEIGGRSAVVRRAAGRAFTVRDPRLETTLAGIPLANPIGLAAGFDKNARAIGMLGALGFGHLEIGSVSADASDGNPKPRLFRIPQDRGIVVAYGVPNDGAAVVRERLDGPRRVPVGLNLVKTNDPARPAAGPEVYEDYAASFRALQDRSDYVALNLSCPNSAADRDFFDELPRIDALLTQLAACDPHVPVILKLKPTRDAGVLREIVAIADGHPFVAGFAINLPAGKPDDLNLSSPRASLERMPGAVGGPPVEQYVNAILATLRSIIGDGSRYDLIAAGGVSTADSAYRKLQLGATAVQLYTGLVYHGPRLVKDILEGLVALLERDGLTLRDLNPPQVLLEPVVLELAWRGEGRDLGEAAGGVERAGFDQVVAGVEEEAGEALLARPRLRGGDQDAASTEAAVLRQDEDAGELTRRVHAQATGGLGGGGAQDEEGSQAGARELLERQVDLLLVGGPAEVPHGELGEVLAQQLDGIAALDRFGADGPHGVHIRVQRDERRHARLLRKQGDQVVRRTRGSSAASRMSAIALETTTRIDATITIACRTGKLRASTAPGISR